jgi:small subunit ribosomal protein S6
MAMPQYEMVFIIQPEMDEEPLAAAVDKISQTIVDLEGKVQQVEPWGKRRLAYPIKKYQDGSYFLMHMELPAQAVRSLERSLKLMEEVIRHLIVRKNESVAA